jgi:hypothetical protein
MKSCPSITDGIFGLVGRNVISSVIAAEFGGRAILIFPSFGNEFSAILAEEGTVF